MAGGEEGQKEKSKVIRVVKVKRKKRKLRDDAPAYVREVVERLEPYLAHAKGRTVMDNSRQWAIH